MDNNDILHLILTHSAFQIDDGGTSIVLYDIENENGRELAHD